MASTLALSLGAFSEAAGPEDLPGLARPEARAWKPDADVGVPSSKLDWSDDGGEGRDRWDSGDEGS